MPNRRCLVSRKTHVPLSAVLNCNEMESQAADLWTGCDFGCVYCLPVARRWARKYSVPIGEGLLQTHVLPRTLPDPLNLATIKGRGGQMPPVFLSLMSDPCLLYTSDAADDLLCVDLGGRR